MSETHGEIIIVRRAEEDTPAKKGGVWKIAHADFMTAMMAFFLIMWLVNATDEEIKKSIANYFNPLDLMAAPTDRRGIMEPNPDTAPPSSGDEAGQSSGRRPLGSNSPGEGQAMDGGGNVETGSNNTMASAGILNETDGPAFNDPFASVASTASDLAPETPRAIDIPQSTVGAVGTTQTTDNLRDPFDPAFWQTEQTEEARTQRPGNPATINEIPPDAVIDAAQPRPRGPAAENSPEARALAAAAAGDGDASATAEGLLAQQTETAPPDPIVAAGPRSSVAEAVFAALGREEDPSEPAPDVTPDDAAEETRQDRLAETAADLRRALEGTDARVSVDEAEGAEAPVLISLTDAEVSMFPIGSAIPNPAAREVFARVADALSAREGSIVVRGHTDARPFRQDTSDNWVLSFARAHATKEVLTGSGIAEQRIVRVEGLADREPLRPDDPLADENRRIEILYEPAGEAP